MVTAGDAEWQPEKKVAAPANLPGSRRPEFAKPGPLRRRAEWVAPSHLEGSRRVSLARVFDAANSEGRNIGTLFHAWFAAIVWIEDGEPNDDQLRAAARQAEWNGDEATITDHIAHFRSILQKPVVRQTFSRDRYPEATRVERERPFVVRVGDHFLNGTIDRIVWIQDATGVERAEVIDFKTDAIPAEAEPQRTAIYRPQMDAYCRAVSAMARLPAERISARLIYTALDLAIPLGIPRHDANMNSPSAQVT